MISSFGDNMVNINAMKKKSIGVIKTILHKLDILHLQKYYFKCAMIFFNVMLRGSILYASEAYYNLTETELRNIERIEEGFLKKIMKTKKSCPIVQLYLETGQWPARFEIKKYILMFLKSILDEDRNSRIFKFVKLQLEKPTKGDWVSQCNKDLIELNIRENFEEITNMQKVTFLNIIEEKLKENALRYLNKKKGSKGN